MPAEEMSVLAERDWPGNVRGLLNELERATILSPGPGLLHLPRSVARLSAPVPSEPSPAEGIAFPTLGEMERRHFERALERAGGKLYGADGAAAMLGLNPSTAKSRMIKLGLGGVRAFKKRSES